MNKPLLNYCLVTQNLASIIEDSEYDSDRYPDVSDISGEVIFTPNLPNGKAYQLVDSDGKTYTVPVSPIRAKIINGEIKHEYSTGVYLFAAGVGSNPDRITYSVEYRNLRSGELSFSLSPLKFEAIPGGVVDLTMATPVIGAIPAGTTKGDKGDPFLYEDFTQEQIDDLKGPLTLADLTPERLETIKGPQGDKGTSIDNVSVDGSDLVFTANEDGVVEISRVPLVEATSVIRDEIADDLTASKNAAAAAEGYANQSASSASDSATYKDISLSAADRAEFAANETIQQVEGDFATRNYVDALKPDVDRGNYSRVLSTLDAESYDTIPPGDYSALTPFFTGIGLPSPIGQGTFSRILTNYRQDGESKLDIARWVIGGEVYEFYRTFSTSGWSDWTHKSDMDTLAVERERTIPDGANWDTITDPGEYRRNNTSFIAINGPTLTPTLGVLAVHSPQHRSGQVTQTFYGAGGGGYWHRAKTSNRWTPWIRMDVIPESPDAPTRLHAGEARREVLVELGKRKRGGVIGTGGLPAVALRFDHHLNYFDEKVLPLLRKYRLPWMQAINAGNLGKGNDIWTAAKLATECHNEGGEVYNHGLDHSTYTTDAEANRQVSGGLTQLTNAIPSLHIDGWAPYGSFPQGAYEAGKSAEDFYNTYPGQLILAQHAFVRSYLPGLHERLAGAQIIGGSHSTIDKDTTGAAIRGLRAAMDRGMGITFMLHPVYLDQEGYMTTTQLDALLSEIASRRDAGELRVLSCTGIMLADKARLDDFNLLGTLSEPNATGTENVNSRGYAITSGVPHEAEVWVKGEGEVTLGVQIDSPTFPVEKSLTIALTAEESQRLSVLVTPPTDSTSTTVSLTGGVTHTGVKYRPI